MVNLAVIGIGNAERGDDAIGLQLLETLDTDQSIACFQQNGDITALFSVFSAYDKVLIVDAYANAKLDVGSVLTVNLNTAELPTESLQSSSHVIDISQSIELARQLEVLPSHCELFAVVCNQFEQGAPLSAALAAQFTSVSEKLQEKIQCMNKV